MWRLGPRGRPYEGTGKFRQPLAWAALPLFKDNGEFEHDAGQDVVLRHLVRYESDRFGLADILEAIQQAQNPRSTKKSKTLPGSELTLRMSPKSADDVVSNTLSPALQPIEVRP